MDVKKWIRKTLRRYVAAAPSHVQRAEKAFYADYLRPGMIAFDVGANIGEITILFSNSVGKGGTVHSFEPVRSTFERLRNACEAAQLHNVVPNRLALAERSGSVSIFVYDQEHASWSTRAERPLKNYGIDVQPVGVEEVSAMTLDDYCKERGIEHVDLLKLDVEGTEYQVLLGAKRMLESKQIGCCVFEFGQTTFDAGNSPDAIEDYLKQCGYHIRNLVQNDPVFPGRESVHTARFSIHVARPE